MEDSILALFTPESSISPVAIAKAVGKKTAKDVNPTLYALQKQGKLHKISEADGSKPRWQLPSVPSRSVPVPSKSGMAYDISILDFLKTQDKPVSEFKILCNVVKFEDLDYSLIILTDVINTALEDLSNKGKILESGNISENMPKWSIDKKGMPEDLEEKIKFKPQELDGSELNYIP